MAQSKAHLAQRWGFMDPWLERLDRHIKYKPVAKEDEVWEAEKRVLEVTLPYKMSPKYERYSDGEFLFDLREIREALVLVAAVAHADQEAWKFILNKIWGFKLGSKGSEEQEEEILARFVLVFDSMAAYSREWNSFADNEAAVLNDLVYFCGTAQRRHPIPEFLTALRDIAARAGLSGKPGVDVKIPIQVAYTDGRGRSSQLFTSILNAEKTIIEQWRAYELRAENRGVETGAIRCTFELGPMMAEITDTYGYYSLAPKLQKLVLQNNVWLSKLTLSPGCGDIYDEIHERRENFRQIVTAAFDRERRSPRRASTRLYFDKGVYLRDRSPLQVNHVEFTSYTGMMMPEFSAILSAMVINQTAKTVSIRGKKRAITNAEQWKWLAYGLFSKRARAYSALESVALNQVDSMDSMDMEAFLSVLNSDHPEEKLCGTSAGVVAERNATLKCGSPIRWFFSRGELVIDDTCTSIIFLP